MNCGVSFAVNEVTDMPKKVKEDQDYLDGGEELIRPKNEAEFKKEQEKAIRERENAQLRKIMTGK